MKKPNRAKMMEHQRRTERKAAKTAKRGSERCVSHNPNSIPVHTFGHKESPQDPDNIEWADPGGIRAGVKFLVGIVICAVVFYILWCMLP